MPFIPAHATKDSIFVLMNVQVLACAAIPLSIPVLTDIYIGDVSWLLNSCFSKQEYNVLA